MIELSRLSGGCLDAEIVIEHDAWSTLDGLDAVITEAAQLAYNQGAKTPAREAAVTVALLSDVAVQALNKQFRGMDKPTNVLSFPVAPPASSVGAPAALAADGDGVPTLGDIVLAYETVAREAAQEAIAMTDHIRHLVAHGVLHLLGYDHETDGDADIMEALETRVLAQLGVADPYAR